jgi:hypothetical protein
VAETAATAAIWAEYDIAPVEIALPGGKAGVTLRAYRPSNEIVPTDVSERQNDDDVFSSRDARQPLDEDDLPEFEWTEEALDEVEAAESDDEVAERVVEGRKKAADDEPDEDEDEDDEEDEPAAVVEDVPLFLSHKGKVLVFTDPKSLVKFAKSNAPHDMAQLPRWKQFTKDLHADDVTPEEDDTYELDLVVENLRSGADGWDNALVLRAGELARDLGYALQLPKVIASLSAGSPLDRLDDALRSAEGGGVGGFMARRKLRKIGAEQAAIGWRTIIGNISGAVDWRD